MAKKRDGSVIIYGPMQANTASQTIGYTDGINHEYTDEDKGNKQLNEIIEDYETRISTIENNGGGSSITIDDKLSATSENPVQNKVVYSSIETRASKDIVEALDSSISYITNNYLKSSDVTRIPNDEIAKLFKTDTTEEQLDE